MHGIVGCGNCHTPKGPTGELPNSELAGGFSIPDADLGNIVVPNITPDPETGIGRWTETEFRRALRDGVRPDGANYFPVFPYPSFTNISDDDAQAMWAYLLSRPPVRQQNRPHDVGFPFSWRFLQLGWKTLFFQPGPFHADPAQNASRNRGAYLVTALSHCGECHTPRNQLGAVERSRFLSGTPDGPEGALVPNITPDRKTGIGDWTKDDLTELLKTGITPEQSKVKGPMREAVEDGLKYLTDADRDAITDYLLALPPIEHAVHKR
jgi:mono/diheme cytochrome c family protein